MEPLKTVGVSQAVRPLRAISLSATGPVLVKPESNSSFAILMDVHSWLPFLFVATFIVAMLAMAQLCN